MNKEKFKSLLIVLGVIAVIFAVTYLFVSAIVGVLSWIYIYLEIVIRCLHSVELIFVCINY